MENVENFEDGSVHHLDKESMLSEKLGKLDVEILSESDKEKRNDKIEKTELELMENLNKINIEISEKQEMLARLSLEELSGDDTKKEAIAKLSKEIKEREDQKIQIESKLDELDQVKMAA